MTDKKISALTDGDPALTGDEIPIERSGANYKITAQTIADLAGAGSMTGTVIASGKTLTVNNSIALTGTDGTTMTFPSAAANVAALNLAGQALSGGATVSVFTATVSSNALTVNPGNRPLQWVLNNSTFTWNSPPSDGSCLVTVANGASAGVITFSTSFKVGTPGDTMTTTSGQTFTVSIWRINGNSSYKIAAHQ